MEKFPQPHSGHNPNVEPDFDVDSTAEEIVEGDTQSDSHEVHEPGTEMVVHEDDGQTTELEAFQGKPTAEIEVIGDTYTLPAPEEEPDSPDPTEEIENDSAADVKKKEIQAKIDEADKILSRYRRAKALSSIATEYNNVEAAERILSPSRFRNPIRFPGSDKSEHDRALEKIASKTNNKDAAEKIKRSNARNRTIHGLGKGALARDGAEKAVTMANEVHGASKRKWTQGLVKEAALSFDERDVDLAIQLVKDEVKSPFARDKIFLELAAKHKDHKILDEIKNPHVRSKARIMITG